MEEEKGVTAQQRTTTIEWGDGGGFGQSAASLSTTWPEALDFDASERAGNRPTAVSPEIGASLLATYFEQVDTGPASEIIGVDIALPTVTIRQFLPPQNRINGSQHRLSVASRRERNAAVIALLEEWVAEDLGDDEEAWNRLKRGIEESRTSTRKRFGD